MIDAFKYAVADEARLRSALEQADIQPLLMVLVHLSEADAPLLDEVAPHIHGAWNFMQRVPAELQARVRDRLVAVLKEYAAGNRAPSIRPSDDLLARMMNTVVGQAVPAEYIPLILEETNLTEADPRTVKWRRQPSEAVLASHDVVIVGAGMSGLCMAIKLKEAGIPFTVLEKNDTVGGTWYENAYPGCGVDTPNHFFSFSFEPNHDWSHHFSPRAELWAYLERCADKYAIRPHIRFNTEVLTADYNEASRRWVLRIRDADGAERTLDARYVITAVGQLNRPSIPAIPGLDDFAGPAFHTARWDASQPVAGKRVAMIGTGASGMQTGPSIAPEVAQLTIFQRTPHWAVYNANYHRAVDEGKQWVLKHIPFYANWYRFTLFWASSDGLHASLQVDPDWKTPDISLNATNQAFREQLIDYIKGQIGDRPDLLEKVVPAYPPYGKRMLRDNHWYKMLTRENVTLVSDAIDHVEPDGIVTVSGEKHPADIIVLATGFQAGRMLFPMQVTGRAGVNLRDLWGDDDPRAYLGIAAPGFPNLFMLYGPNTNLGHGGSIIFHTECQVRYIMQSLREMIEAGREEIECRTEPHDAYNERVDQAHRNMVWAHGGVGNWYKNRNGRVIANSPWRLVDYWAMTAEFKPEDYVIG